MQSLKAGKVYFGWWTVIAGGLIAFLGVGFVSYGFSVFFKSIAADLALSRAATSLANGIQNFGGGIAGITGGIAGDKYGPKRVIIVGIFLLAAGSIAMFFVHSLWALMIVWGLVIGVGFSLGFTIILDKAIVNWFVKKSGVALNIKFAIQSLSGLALLPVMAWMTTSIGWRWASVIAGVTILLVCLPLAWFFIKSQRPEHYGLLPDGGQQPAKGQNQAVNGGQKANYAGRFESVEFGVRQTTKTIGFWMLVAVVFISGLATPIMGVHCVPFLTDMGIDPVKAAGMMSIWVTCSIPARIVSGLVVDRLKTGQMRYIIVAGYAVQAAGVAAYLFTRSTAAIYVWFILYGIGQGISSGAFLPIVASYFGRKSFGSIIGTMMLLNLPVMLAAPVYVGWVYDSTGSYISVFTLMAVLLVASGIAAGFISPPKSPLPVTAIPAKTAT